MAASKSSRTRTKPTPVRSSPTHHSPAPVRTSGVSGRGRAASTPVRAGQGDDVAPEPSRTALAPTWLQWTTFGLAILALAASSYLTYQHYTAGKTFFGCAGKGFINCGLVTTSAESHILGIPVALLGLLFYVFMVPALSPWAWRLTGGSLIARRLPLVRLGSICVGICLVLWLIYAELFKIGSICIYCTSVHIVTFLLFVLIMLAAAMWGLNPNREA
jgi:uncharacterized membrane protein